MHALALSADSKLLAAVGKDECGRQVPHCYDFIFIKISITCILMVF